MTAKLRKADSIARVVNNAFSQTLAARQDAAVREFREIHPSMTSRDENAVRKAVAEFSAHKRATRKAPRRSVIVRGYVIG